MQLCELYGLLKGLYAIPKNLCAKIFSYRGSDEEHSCVHNFGISTDAQNSKVNLYRLCAGTPTEF